MDQITDYASLQAAVAGMMHRTDLTASIPLFIQLCEADLNDSLLLKDMESDEALTLTTGNNYVALPSGYISPIAFWLVISGYRTELQPVLPQQLPYDISNSIPRWYAIDGANIRFDCPAGDAYSAFLRCIKKSNLSNSTTTNPLLLASPDVYLFGTLKQACLYTRDDAAVQKWSAMFDDAVKGAKASDARSRSIVPLRTDIVSRLRHSIFRGD